MLVSPASAVSDWTPDRRPSLSQPQAANEAGAQSSSMLRGGLPRWRLRRVLDFVDQNLSSDIRLKHLAEAARLSAHHFSELFRQTTGVSPYRYVLDRRVERAKRLLRDSMLGVLDIALAVGFSDQSHFSKVFRRATGVAPGAYRTIQWAEGMPAFESIPEDQTKDRGIVLTTAR